MNKDYQLIISNNKGGYLLEYIPPHCHKKVIFDIEIEIDKNNAFFMPDNNVSIQYSNNNSIPNSNITGGFMNLKKKVSCDKEESGNQFKNYSGKLVKNIKAKSYKSGVTKKNKKNNKNGSKKKY